MGDPSLAPRYCWSDFGGHEVLRRTEQVISGAISPRFFVPADDVFEARLDSYSCWWGMKPRS